MNVLNTTISPVLRGVSQIFFVENALSGLLILTGLAVVDIKLAGLVLLGSVVQSAGAAALNLRDDVRHGLMGYNGALVGAAAALYAGFSAVAVMLTVVGALACIAVHEVLRVLFGNPRLSRFALPVSTAPFCIVAGLTWRGLGQLVEPAELTTSDAWGSGMMLGVFNSFSEVILADGLLCGVLILTGLLIDSPTIGGFGFAGAAAALLASVVIHDGISEPSSGLYGYSAVLVSIALGAVFWTERSWVGRCIGAAVGVALTLLIQPLLATTPVPVFTWPFLISMWIVMLVGGIRPVSRYPAEDERTSDSNSFTDLEAADDPVAKLKTSRPLRRKFTQLQPKAEDSERGAL